MTTVPKVTACNHGEYGLIFDSAEKAEQARAHLAAVEDLIEGCRSLARYIDALKRQWEANEGQLAPAPDGKGAIAQSDDLDSLFSAMDQAVGNALAKIDGKPTGPIQIGGQT